jgi:hypothetical protein
LRGEGRYARLGPYPISTLSPPRPPRPSEARSRGSLPPALALPQRARVWPENDLSFEDEEWGMGLGWCSRVSVYLLAISTRACSLIRTTVVLTRKKQPCHSMQVRIRLLHFGRTLFSEGLFASTGFTSPCASSPSHRFDRHDLAWSFVATLFECWDWLATLIHVGTPIRKGEATLGRVQEVARFPKSDFEAH